MKKISPLKKRIIYSLISLSVLFYVYVLSYNFFFKNTNLDTLSFKPIPEKDSLMLANTVDLNKLLLDSSFLITNKIVRYNYYPTALLNYNDRLPYNGKNKFYYVKLNEIDAAPQLIETRINRVKVSLSNHYELSNDSRLISFKFVTLSYSAKNLHYQFSCNSDNNYEDFGNENTLNIHIPTGITVLYIRAVDFTTKTVTKFSKITLFSRKHISKQVWFWPLVILTAFLPIFLFLFLIKMNKQEARAKQQELLLQQSNKITSDLHDDIGASLSSLQINSNVAKQILDTKPEEAKKMLEKIELISENLADKIGDFIWSMKPGKEEFLTISSRIKNFINEILGSTNMEYKINIDTAIDKAIVDITIRKNIVLVIKEAVNNIAKYSQATKVNIDLQLTNKTIIINVIDNGIGFDINNKKGNGIGNMQKRIEELNGMFEIVSAANKGTTIKANLLCT